MTQLTSIQASSFMSPESSLDLLLPLTACRLLGGAQSSTAPDAGLFLSSILTKAAGRGSADGEVAIGIRKGAATTTGTRKKGEEKEDGMKILVGAREMAEWRPVVVCPSDAPERKK